MSAPTIGSLCTGYGGLEMGLQAVVGGAVAWHCENDPHASKILSHRWPTHVPNYGDITTVDWYEVERVDWLCAGFPCQPASSAGKRGGMADERWLWDAVARAIQGVRPNSVLLENVPGLLTVDRGRAFERIVCDLASLGYVGWWGVVRASDAGAAHGRSRLFVFAADATSESGGFGYGNDVRAGWSQDGQRKATGRGASSDADFPRSQGPESAQRCDMSTRCAAANPAGNGWDQRRTKPARVVGRPDVAECGGSVADWGKYETAIRRWEIVTGRLAPRPTEPGRNGERLSPRFVEWMQGLPEGHVTDVDIPRNAQLKALGNGVVPQQAALALRTLLPLALGSEGAA